MGLDLETDSAQAALNHREVIKCINAAVGSVLPGAQPSGIVRSDDHNFGAHPPMGAVAPEEPHPLHLRLVEIDPNQVGPTNLAHGEGVLAPLCHDYVKAQLLHESVWRMARRRTVQD